VITRAVSAVSYLSSAHPIFFEHFTISAIDGCPAILDEILTRLASETGWLFSVLMDGPCPKDASAIAVAR